MKAQELEDPLTLSFTIVPIVEELNGGVIKVEFQNKTLIKGRDDPLAFLKEEEAKISPVGYYSAGEQEQQIQSVASSATTGMKAVMVSTTVVSAPSAFVLVKLIQMVELLLLINVKHPRNLSTFLDMISGTIFEDLPNIFEPATNEKCFVEKEKFAEQELSCYIFLNLGSYFVMLLLYFLLFLILIGLHHLCGQKTRTGKWFKSWKDKMNIVFWLDLMQSVQLDVFLNLFIVVTRLHHNDPLTSFNFTFTIFLAIFWVGISIYMMYLTQLAYTSKKIVENNKEVEEKRKKRKSTLSKNKRGQTSAFVPAENPKLVEAKKIIESYGVLLEDLKLDKFYQRHYKAMILFKDVIISFGVVIYHDYPRVQTSIMVFGFLVFVIADAAYRPFTDFRANFMEVLKGVDYGLCCVLFLVLSIVEDTMSKKNQFNYIGYPLIALIALLIFSEVVNSFVDSYLNMREKCKNCQKKKKKVETDQPQAGVTISQSQAENRNLSE